MPEPVLIAWGLYAVAATSTVAGVWLCYADDVPRLAAWKRWGLALACGLGWPLAVPGTLALALWDRWRGF